MAHLVPSRRLLRHLSSVADAQLLQSLQCRSISPCRLFVARRCLTTHHLRDHRNIRSGNIPASRRWESTPAQSPSLSSESAASLGTSLPDISTYYSIFPCTLPAGPPPGGPFAIPLVPLRKEFLQLQSQHHPDKSPSGKPLQQHALALSALINTAYRTLSDPLLRAQYLLQLRYGVDVTNEDNAAHPADQATLLAVMEAQEQIEEATEQAEVDVLKRDNAARIEGTVAMLGEAFETDNRDGAVRECVRLRYWTSLGEGLADWEKGKAVKLVH